MTEQLGKRQHPRRLGLDIPKPVKIVAGVTLATTAAVGGGFAIADQMGAFDTGTPDQGHTLVVPPTPTPDKIPGTAIPTPTNTETPKSTPTPEKTKTVGWSMEQIAKAQKDALTNNKVLFADTWTENGGKAQEAKSGIDRPLLVLDFDEKPEGKTFVSPISGVVTTSNARVTLNDGTKIRTISIMVNNIEVGIYTDIDSKILVEYGQKISLGTPLIELSGNPIPQGAHFSKPGYVALSDSTNFSISKDSILHDENGANVAIQK